jgi:hypothetical protein
MAVGDKKHYRIKQIQLRDFYQAGQSAGIKKDEMDDIMTVLAKQIDDALAVVKDEAEQNGSTRVNIRTHFVRCGQARAFTRVLLMALKRDSR